MKNRNYMVLKKIVKYCNQIDEANNAFTPSLEEFAQNSVYRNACCMCVLQIGELAKALTEDFRNEYKGVKWRGWCGIRDIFAHQYSGMKIDVAWDTVENDVPKLKEYVERILRELEGEELA